MFRVGIIFEDGNILGQSFEEKRQAEDFILLEADKRKIKRADIRNLETNEREQVI